MSAFDPAWPHGHVTRDGRKARIICTDAKGEYPIVALAECADGNELPLWTDANGCCCPSYSDLLNAPAPKLKVATNGDLHIYQDRNRIGTWFYFSVSGPRPPAASLDLVATIRIRGEIEEGAEITLQIP